MVFPAGYDTIEHLPDDLRYDSPRLTSRTTVDRTPDGRLRVTLRRQTPRQDARLFPADYAPLFRERARQINSRANRQITVRKNQKIRGK